jgi:hypothetical protein
MSERAPRPESPDGPKARTARKPGRPESPDGPKARTARKPGRPGCLQILRAPLGRTSGAGARSRACAAHAQLAAHRRACVPASSPTADSRLAQPIYRNLGAYTYRSFVASIAGSAHIATEVLGGARRYCYADCTHLLSVGARRSRPCRATRNRHRRRRRMRRRGSRASRPRAGPRRRILRNRARGQCWPHLHWDLPTSAPGLTEPHLRRDSPTSAPGLAHICARLAHICHGTSPHLHRDLHRAGLAIPCDWAID